MKKTYIEPACFSVEIEDEGFIATSESGEPYLIKKEEDSTQKFSDPFQYNL